MLVRSSTSTWCAFRPSRHVLVACATFPPFMLVLVLAVCGACSVFRFLFRCSCGKQTTTARMPSDAETAHIPGIILCLPVRTCVPGTWYLVWCYHRYGVVVHHIWDRFGLLFDEAFERCSCYYSPGTAVVVPGLGLQPRFGDIPVKL